MVSFKGFLVVNFDIAKVGNLVFDSVLLTQIVGGAVINFIRDFGGNFVNCSVLGFDSVAGFDVVVLEIIGVIPGISCLLTVDCE
jgi:hypothetical protein